MTTGAAHSARALEWDSVPFNAQADGGGGVWDLNNFNWSFDGGAGGNLPWTNANPAVFGGPAGGEVQIAGGIRASSLTFNTAGYALTGAELLTLVSNPTITTNADATVAVSLQTSGELWKYGAGKLTLGSPTGNNVGITGPVYVEAGALELRAPMAAGTGMVHVATGATLVVNGTNVANNLFMTGGALRMAGDADVAVTGQMFMNAPVAIAVPVAGRTMTLGYVGGSQPITVDVGGGGTLRVAGAFENSNNSYQGNLTVNSTGGQAGRVALAYRIEAPPGQTFSATAGTLSLGDSVGRVWLHPGATVSATGTGVVELSGRVSGVGPDPGVIVGGNLTATAGGRIVVGDPAADGSPIEFYGGANLAADAGTIVLRSRGTPLTLDGTKINALTVANGGALVLGAGSADLTINKDVTQSGAWSLVNQSASLLKVAAGSQDSTAGLTLRAESGVIRYEATTLNVGPAAANGTANVELRGGTFDLRNDVPGVQFTYAPAGIVGGWGQIGTSAANQAHVIPAGGGVQFYSNAPAAAAGTLAVVGAIDESAGTKAAFRIADNAGISLAVPNATQATAYALGTGAVAVDAQGSGNAARLIAAGGIVRANANAFAGAANNVRLEATAGGTLVTDLTGVGTVLRAGPGGALRVTGGGTIVTSASAFTLNAGDVIGGAGGTLFGFAGTATVPTTALTLKGTLALDGSLGATIAAGSNGTIALSGGQTLKLLGAADLTQATLSYAGAATGPATLEAAAGGTNLVRIGAATPINTAPEFAGARQFTATSGVLQVDAADAHTVTVGPAGALSVDRTADSTVNPTPFGALALNGGTFQIGATASATTVAGALTGKGIYGHTATVDTFVNQGTVQAVGGALTINSGVIRATDTSAFDPNGQTLTLRGGLADFDATTKSKLRVTGAAGGTVTVTPGIAAPIPMSGGAEVTGTAAARVTLRVTATGALGTGPITITNGQLSLNSDAGADLSANTVAIEGAVGSSSVIAFDRLNSAPTRIHKLGALTMNGQSLTFQGANGHTLNVAGMTVGPLGGTLTSFNQVGNASLAQVTAPTTVNGPLVIDVRNTLDLFGLAGGGSVTRTVQSGTLNFRAASPTFTGTVDLSGGTTRFQAANTLGTTAAVTLRGGSFVLEAANALSGATAVTATPLVGSGETKIFATVPDALGGATVTLTRALPDYLEASAANALGTGTVVLANGQLRLVSPTSTSFGGTVTTTPGLLSTFVVGPVNGGSLPGQTHGIGTLAPAGGTLNISTTNGYKLDVGAVTAGGTTGSNLSNETGGLTTPTLTLNQPLSAYGSGSYTVGRVGGAAKLTYSGTGTLTLTGTALPGFTGTIEAAGGGTINLNDPASSSLAGGVLSVNGGRVNLNTAGALGGSSVTVSSGTLVAAVPNALNGWTVPVSSLA